MIETFVMFRLFANVMKEKANKNRENFRFFLKRYIINPLNMDIEL